MTRRLDNSVSTAAALAAVVAAYLTSACGTAVKSIAPAVGDEERTSRRSSSPVPEEDTGAQADSPVSTEEAPPADEPAAAEVITIERGLVISRPFIQTRDLLTLSIADELLANGVTYSIVDVTTGNRLVDSADVDALRANGGIGLADAGRVEWSISPAQLPSETFAFLAEGEDLRVEVSGLDLNTYVSIAAITFKDYAAIDAVPYGFTEPGDGSSSGDSVASEIWISNVAEPYASDSQGFTACLGFIDCFSE